LLCVHLLIGVAAGFIVNATAVSAAPNPAYGSAPLVRLANNRLAVKVAINGRGPFLFLIDSATSNTIFTPVTRERLGLTPSPGGPIDVVTAAGQTRSHFYKIDETAVAGVIVEGVRAVVLPLPDGLGIDGALGADFLANFTVDLNQPARTITLYPENTDLGLPGFRRVKGWAEPHGFIVVPANVEGVVASAVFDSGAAFTVGNPNLAHATMRTGVPTARAVESMITDAVRQRAFAEAFNFARLDLGPASWWDARVLIANMRVFDQIGLGAKPCIFIGMDLMQGRRVILDYGSASLWLAPSQG
jgi:hypothetical protein